MKPSYFVFIVGICLLVVIGRPVIGPKSNQSAERQEEQALPEDEVYEEIQGTQLKVEYAPQTEREANVADILWMKEAAELALSYGTPYFHVKDQNATEDGIVGTIELETDPMAAEFDAHVIKQLGLPQPK